MTDGIIIVIACSIVALLISMAWRRRRDVAEQQSWMTSPGWSECTVEFRKSMGPLKRLALTEIGHSRRVDSAFRASDGALVITYVCETGFERRRNSHRFFVVACPLTGTSSRVIITREEWLLAAAQRPDLHLVSVEKSSRKQDVNGYGDLKLASASPRDISARLSRGLLEWLHSQSEERSWEVVGLYAFGYQPATQKPEDALELVKSVRELARLVTVHDKT
jgi:hypothetical protein